MILTEDILLDLERKYGQHTHWHFGCENWVWILDGSGLWFAADKEQ